MNPAKTYKPNDEDRDFVLRFMEAENNVSKCAEALNLHDDTVRKYYKFEIMTARAVLKGKATTALNWALDDGSLEAAKFVLARLAGWSETTIRDHTGTVDVNHHHVLESINRKLDRLAIANGTEKVPGGPKPNGNAGA